MAQHLFEIPGNPVPEQARAGLFNAEDGKTIRYAVVGATARPLKGTVVVLPGRNECIEKYFETMGDLSARGFTVAILDWRGQGGSCRLLRDSQRGHIDSFFDYTRDLEQFFQEVVLPDCRPPYYVLGHSTGGLIALLAAPALINQVRRMVLCAPLIALKDLAISMLTLRRLMALLYNIGLGGMYISGGPRKPVPFAINRLTSDFARYERNAALCEAHPHLALGGPTVAWMHAACRAVETVQDPDFMARITIPVLFIAAGADEIVSTPAIEDYARHLRAGSVVTIDGARHEILQEADRYREQFLAAFDAFVPGTDTEMWASRRPTQAA